MVHDDERAELRLPGHERLELRFDEVVEIRELLYIDDAVYSLQASSRCKVFESNSNLRTCASIGVAFDNSDDFRLCDDGTDTL